MVPNADGTARDSALWLPWRRIIPPGRVAYRVAAALADGEPISWAHVRSLTRWSYDRGLVDALASIASLARANHASSAPQHGATALPLLLAMALRGTGVCLAVGVLAGLFYAPHDHRFWAAQLGLALSFGSAAALLRFGGREDVRAQWLMATYVLIAWAFAKPLAMDAPGAVLLTGFCPEAFLPYTLWRFAEVFPRTERFTWIDRTSRIFGDVSLVAGSTLFVVNVLLAWNPAVADGALVPLGRSHPAQAFWDVVYVLLLPAALAIPLRTWSAPPAERHRVRLFGAALGAGLIPMLAHGVAEHFTVTQVLVFGSNARRSVADAIAVGALLLTPWLTVYAVLVRHALQVHVVLLKATQYALARNTLTLLVLLPVAVLLTWVYAHRQQPVASLFSSSTGQLLGAGLGFSLLLASARDRLLTLLDSLFSRAQLPHTQYLAQCTRELQLACSASGIASVVEHHVRDAFGVHVVSLLRPTGEGAVPVYGSALPLGRSALLVLLAETASPVSLSNSSLQRLLPSGDLDWVRACGAVMLVPLRETDGSMAAVLVLGQKASGLPWDAQDALALSTIANAAGLALSRVRDHEPQPILTGHEFAAECVDCGSIAIGRETRCPCGGEWAPSALPSVLSGKFSVERRIGRGGMGLVYRAQDLSLGRTVALKTLPRVELAALRRLRDEARSMARVLDPHLALIFGVESWRNTPVLVIEHLGGGTLAQRLQRGPLTPSEVGALGRRLSSALGVLHDNGLMHGDVKPSNIGFTRDGTCKLLDFGLSRALLQASETKEVRGSAHSLHSSSVVGGTPAYLSPELVRGGRPSVQSDLWALAVVLLEALIGTNPFVARTVERVFDRVRAPTDIVKACCLGLTKDLADLFGLLLATDQAMRPSSAAQFDTMLSKCPTLQVFGS